MKKENGWVRTGLITLTIAILGGGGWWWYRSTQTGATGADKSGASAEAKSGAAGAGGRGGPGGRGAVPAVIDQVRVSEVPVIVTAIGTVTARSTAAARARVDGLLQSVSFREGQLVRAGEVMARIDPLPFQAALQSAQGQLAKDQAQLDSAKIDLTRYQKLLEQDSIARQQVEAQAALVKQLEGTLLGDRAQVATAQLNLGYTEVKAPITGRTGLRQVDAGNMVRSSDANGIVVITEVQPITTVFSLPQEVLPSVLAKMGRDTKGAPRLTVQVLDRDGRTVLDTGELLAVDNQIDAATGTVKLKAVFPNKSNTLFPNQFVNMKLELERLEAAITVPQSAVQRGAPGIYVYVVTTDKTASLRKVQLGPVTGDRVVITTGLKEGDSIVIDGADKLRDGAPVTTVQAAPAAAQRGPRGDRAKKDGAASGDGKATVATDAAPNSPPGAASANAPSSAAAPTRNPESKPITPAAATSTDAPKKPWSELSDVEKAERKKQREASGEAPRFPPKQ
jgi:membrane fusion protein, multidrug efflux system